MISNRGRHNRRELAQGMVEFALVLPVVLLLVFGIMEFGRFLFIFTTVNSASREAARYGASAGYDSNLVYHFDDCAGIREAAEKVAILANVQSIQIRYDRGTDGTELAQPCETNTEHIKLKYRVVVTVTAEFVPVVPVVNIGTIPITSISKRTIVKDVVVGDYVQ